MRAYFVYTKFLKQNTAKPNNTGNLLIYIIFYADNLICNEIGFILS